MNSLDFSRIKYLQTNIGLSGPLPSSLKPQTVSVLNQLLLSSFSDEHIEILRPLAGRIALLSFIKDQSSIPKQSAGHDSQEEHLTIHDLFNDSPSKLIHSLYFDKISKKKSPDSRLEYLNLEIKNSAKTKKFEALSLTKFLFTKLGCLEDFNATITLLNQKKISGENLISLCNSSAPLIKVDRNKKHTEAILNNLSSLNTQKRTELSKNIQYLIQENMTGTDLYSIFKAVRNITKTDRTSTCKATSLLVRENMKGADVETILQIVHLIQNCKRTSFCEMTSPLITVGMTGQDVAHILKTVKSLNKNKRLELCQTTSTLIKAGMPGPDAHHILTQLIPMKLQQRVKLCEAVNRFISDEGIQSEYISYFFEIFQRLSKSEGILAISERSVRMADVNQFLYSELVTSRNPALGISIIAHQGPLRLQENHPLLIRARNTTPQNMYLQDFQLATTIPALQMLRLDTLYLANPNLEEKVNEWLAKLTLYAPEFLHPQTRPEFATQVLKILELAQENLEYQTIFSNCLDEALSSCVDRAMFVINHMTLEKDLIDAKSKPLQEVIEIFKGVFKLSLLENISRTFMYSHPDADEVEVYLGFITKLKDRLNLPTYLSRMVFFRQSQITSNDLTSAAAEVSSRLETSEEFVNFLSSDRKWEDFLEANVCFKEQLELLRETLSIELSQAEESANYLQRAKYLQTQYEQEKKELIKKTTESLLEQLDPAA